MYYECSIFSKTLQNPNISVEIENKTYKNDFELIDKIVFLLLICRLGNYYMKN